ncbi:uncharacterized protein BDR25DRAFT_300417 [Lindgomyces ingoldianus]|uniref:Uncharacterized protein n=1 Tax=Lindgomyces ingoldianus TaxID=673940 RepID=A0ACB6RAU1_9PLEO|nr:uncharacterized protein BDR25DRAFT_300417 [Lindgomyces ingoldianus]KAF2476398.1 hypothetical protein BDR25DRAFT_300417 [Lindgomyces ingoldianus]
MSRSSAASVTPSPQPSLQRDPEPAWESTPITSARSLRQLSIFFLGATCLAVSTIITRRAIHRRLLRITPKFYEPNTNPHEHFSPAMDAMQALNLATLNVFSVGIMVTGGTLWAFDISSLGEMQAALRGRLGYENFDKHDQDVTEAPSSLEESILHKRKEEARSNGPKTP